MLSDISEASHAERAANACSGLGEALEREVSLGRRASPGSPKEVEDLNSLTGLIEMVREECHPFLSLCRMFGK
jgi:hypothetical protein